MKTLSATAFIPVRLDLDTGKEYLHLDGMTYLREATLKAAQRVEARWAERNPLERIAECKIEELPNKRRAS